MKALVFVVPVMALMSSACSKTGDGDQGATGDPVGPTATPTQAAPKLGSDHPAVVLIDAAGTEHRVYVEVVRSEAKRRRGLMYRQHLGVDRGMLFIFDEMAQQSFWMKNTLISLDILFITDELEILGIADRAEPKTLTSQRVPGKSIYVLEVNGGWSAERGVSAGSVVRFENVEL